MCSNIRTFPPSPPALLGAMSGLKVNSNSQSEQRRKPEQHLEQQQPADQPIARATCFTANIQVVRSGSGFGFGSGSGSSSSSRSWGPLCGGGGWEIRPVRGARMDARRFSKAQDVLSKTPPDRRELAASSRAPHRGRLSFGYFSLAIQRKVTRPPLRWTKPCDKD